MKLTYWYAKCLDDDNAYSIRTRTKKDCKGQRAGDEDSYGPPVKVTIEYKDGFDLMQKIALDGGPEGAAYHSGGMPFHPQHDTPTDKEEN
jgi:hypothetical protein